MSPISSKQASVLDGSAEGFRRAAGDVGEVIAVLSGGVATNQWTRARLTAALRDIQAHLVAEAHEQGGREAVLAMLDADAVVAVGGPLGVGAGNA